MFISSKVSLNGEFVAYRHSFNHEIVDGFYVHKKSIVYQNQISVERRKSAEEKKHDNVYFAPFLKIPEAEKVSAKFVGKFHALT